MSWRWRIEAKGEEYFKPYRVQTLVTAIHLPVDERFPRRTRDRLEKALKQLEMDKVLAGFHYKGWLDDWLQASVLIEPPDVVVDNYQNIGSHMRIANIDLADRIREKRMAERLGRLRAGFLQQVRPARVLQCMRMGQAERDAAEFAVHDAEDRLIASRIDRAEQILELRGREVLRWFCGNAAFERNSLTILFRWGRNRGVSVNVFDRRHVCGLP